jgi:hypothetical protein
LNKLLERIEGHFIRGYGDQQEPDTEIELLQEAVEAANEFLRENDTSKERLQKVSDVITGFETPYGVELLSTVHWVSRYSRPRATNENTAIAAVLNWNERKRKMFKEPHIQAAWQKLDEQGWLRV